MNNNSLKEILLKEHDRDKRLTYLSFAFYGVLGIIAAYFILETLLQKFNSNTPIFYNFIVVAVLIGFVVVFVKKIKAINNRHLQIEELFNKLQEGGRTTSVSQFTAYKVQLPLGRINIKLYPVNFISFLLNNQNYTLPVPVSTEPHFKTLLSGADIEKVNKLKEELNNDSVIETQENVPLKSITEFKTFAEAELSGDAKNMEKGRKKGLNMSIISISVTVLAIAGFYYFNYSRLHEVNTLENSGSGYSSMYYYFIGFAVLCGLLYIVYLPFLKRNNNNQNPASFKEQILKKIIAFINPSFQYVEHGYIGLSELFDFGILKEKNYDVSGNDLILGKHNGVPFQYCDLAISYQPALQIKGQSPEEIFSGQFFAAKFNKDFKTQIAIIPKKGISSFITGNSFSSNINQPSDKILLEDPEFTKMFDVYANDQIEARYILTTTTMQNIKDVANKAKGNLFLFFINNKIIVANNNRQNKFETNLMTKINSDLLVSFYEDLYKQFSIINDLKLNINIWKQKTN